MNQRCSVLSHVSPQNGHIPVGVQSENSQENQTTLTPKGLFCLQQHGLKFPEEKLQNSPFNLLIIMKEGHS